MGANPSSTKGPKLPVTNVSWTDCRDSAAKLTERGRGGGGVQGRQPLLSREADSAGHRFEWPTLSPSTLSERSSPSGHT